MRIYKVWASPKAGGEPVSLGLYVADGQYQAIGEAKARLDLDLAAKQNYMAQVWNGTMDSEMG